MKNFILFILLFLFSFTSSLSSQTLVRNYYKDVSDFSHLSEQKLAETLYNWVRDKFNHLNDNYYEGNLAKYQDFTESHFRSLQGENISARRAHVHIKVHEGKLFLCSMWSIPVLIEYRDIHGNQHMLFLGDGNLMVIHESLIDKKAPFRFRYLSHYTHVYDMDDILGPIAWYEWIEVEMW